MTSTNPCPEHAELDAKITLCAQALRAISARSSRLACTPNYQSSEIFRMLLAESAVATARLHALRECLELHEGAHGCASPHRQVAA